MLVIVQFRAIIGWCRSKSYDGGWKYGVDKQWRCNCAWASKWKDSFEVGEYDIRISSSYELKIDAYHCYCRHCDM